MFNKKLKTKTYNYFDDADFNVNERISPNRLYSDNAMPSIESLSDDIETSNIHVISVSKDSGDVDKSFEKGDPNKRYETLLDRRWPQVVFGHCRLVIYSHQHLNFR